MNRASLPRVTGFRPNLYKSCISKKGPKNMAAVELYGSADDRYIRMKTARHSYLSNSLSLWAAIQIWR